MGLYLLTPPTADPVTVLEAKNFCKVTTDDEDALFQSLITAATRHLERDLNVSLSEQQWKLSLNWFSDRIELPRGPVIRIDAIEYLNEEGLNQTADPALYRAVLESERQSLERNFDITAPTAKVGSDVVSITYTAGIGDIETGQDIWLALLFLIQHFYTRGISADGLPQIVTLLSQPYRRYT